MPSHKRTSAVFEEDSDEEIDVEQASSSLQQNAPKRPRTVLAQEHGGSTISDDDDSDTMAPESRFGTAMPDEDMHHTNEDEGEEDEVADLEDEFDEVERAQIIKRLFGGRTGNRAMDHGIIEEIFCRNFMCHTKLRIKLGPLINFVIGHNGSGKSAVLTALTVCLGSKATATNRGSSLKDMIKQGEETAVLAVKIKNQGSGAYRAELYGESIIVERHFSRSGAPGFKLKNAQDKVVSTKKRDLDEIIDFFALQLDNPINVLNQDMARQFLSNSTTHDKYKFFIKGTQLETLDTDYKLLEESLDSIMVRLANRIDDIAVLKAKAEEAEKRKKRLEASDTIRLEVQKTQRMYVWAQVEKQEQLLDETKESVLAEQDGLAKAEQEAETATGVYEGAQQAHERSQQVVADLTQQLEPSIAKRGEEQTIFDAGKSRLLDMHADLRSAKTDHKNEKRKQEDLRAKIETENALLADANGHDHTLRLERMDQLKAERLRAEEDRQVHDESHPDLERGVREAAKRVADAEIPLTEAKNIVERAEATLRDMERDQNQRFTGYKRNTDRVVEMINRETRWRVKPAGPMGQHIKLRNPKWGGLIERTIGGILESFAVVCNEDRKMLADIMQKANYHSAIYVGPAAPLNTANHEPSPDVTTIFRVLDIDNDLVRNQLIITQSIEQIVLIEYSQAGHDYLFAGGRRPAKVKAVLTFDGSGKGNGVRYDMSRTGAARSSSLAQWVGRSRMRISQQEQIENQQRAIVLAKRELDQVSQAHRRTREQQETAKQEILKFKRAKNEKTTAVQRLIDEIETLQDEIDRNRPQDGRLQELESQLTAANDGEAACSHIVLDLINQKAVLDESQREVKTRLDVITAEVQEREQNVESAEKESRRLNRKREEVLRAKNESIQAVGNRQEQLQSKIEARDEQQKNLDENFIAGAQQTCLRVPVDPGMTPDKLDDLLEKYQRDLARAERQAGGSLEELTVAWGEARTALHTAEQEHHQMQELSNTLKFSLHNRKQRWAEFRRWITLRARLSFQYLLSERQFRGKLLLDHYDKKLGVQVEPNGASVSDVGREARTLSGGEKSFSTICLLLSIWEAMGSPIRCLDEFDVFMDSANRATSMTMMIQAARGSVGRQYIFITPQAMQNVELGEDVRIHKMSDPERGQQALPFTQG